jgi:hypothetical protein
VASRVGILALVVAVWAGAAAAHPAPYSDVGLRLEATRIRGTLVFHVYDVAHELGLPDPDALLLMPPPAVIEPAIALSIVVVGVDNLLVRHAREARDLRPWAALAFGLVHGFGFASVLREFGLPPTALGWSLFSFNVGVEIGQAAIVAIVAGLVLMLRRRNARLAERVAIAASVVVIACGGWWFAERVLA